MVGSVAKRQEISSLARKFCQPASCCKLTWISKLQIIIIPSPLDTHMKSLCDENAALFADGDVSRGVGIFFTTQLMAQSQGRHILMHFLLLITNRSPPLNHHHKTRQVVLVQLMGVNCCLLSLIIITVRLL
eukprot:scaffold17562_cov140-Skeletonema_dohrnii-CCMP3373.AAC.2